MIEFDFKKSLGQNFLRDDNIPNKIALYSGIDKDTLVIEVGPGAGSLSKKIIPMSKFSLLYEIDTRLESILNNELREFDNYALIFSDILDVNLTEEIKKYDYKKLYLVANLPYYITTPIITKVISEVSPDRIVIMIQEEVADRLSANVSTKDYGMISALFQSEYDIKKLFKVSRKCFIPEPNVDSAVVCFDKKINSSSFDRDKLVKLLKDSFQYKRKNLRNNLKKYDLNKIESILIKHDLNLTNRAEDVSPDIFIEISREI